MNNDNRCPVCDDLLNKQGTCNSCEADLKESASYD